MNEQFNSLSDYAERLKVDNICGVSVSDHLFILALHRYLGLKGLLPKEVHVDMVATLEEGAPSYSRVLSIFSDSADLPFSIT